MKCNDAFEPEETVAGLYLDISEPFDGVREDDLILELFFLNIPSDITSPSYTEKNIRAIYISKNAENSTVLNIWCPSGICS
jgi:hypothetical protein